MKSRRDVVDEWNKQHCKVASNPNRNNIMADWCEQLILDAKHAYYKTGNPIMEDDAYDMLERNLKSLRPESKILERLE